MGPKILLVEDEPGLVMTLTDRLQGEGYLVDSAMDGESGLTQASGNAYDLIILDVMLPRKSGLDI
ncbi:MAG: response regulator, partial [Acidobacteria bacterium]|nr:response regulator [Acidobacteriota bacterium]